MDEERKDLEEEEKEAEVEEQPDFDEFDADAAPLEEQYHQMSFPEEQPELFGDSAAEEAREVQTEILEDGGAGAYAAAQQKAEEDREVDEILEKRSAVNPVPKNDSWKSIHSEFAAEVERFAHEAEDFAKKVNDYINDPDMNFGLDDEDKDKNEAPKASAQEPESQKNSGLSYMDVEPEEVQIPSQEETIIPEPQPKPAEPRRRTKRRKPPREVQADVQAAPAEAEEPAEAEAAPATLTAEERKAEAAARKEEKRRRKEERRRAKAAADAARQREQLDAREAFFDPAEETGESGAPRRHHLKFDKSKWRREPYPAAINEVAIPAEFDIPVGTQEEWEAGEAEEPVIAERERPKYSFNDDPTRELSPVDEHSCRI